MNLERLALMVLILVAVSSSAGADQLRLQSGHPDRYVVKPGDTLWGISGHFLEDPWRWPEIWHANPFVDDPHLIFPGDVLLLTNIDGRPALKALRRENLRVEQASPRIREEKIDDAITTIPPGVIQPFLTIPLVVDRGGLDDLGYVVVGVEGSIVLGPPSEFYARNVAEPASRIYQVFRPGDDLFHPVTREYLGTEAVYLGEAAMVRPGETSKLTILRAVDEITPADRLIPVERDVVQPYFHPRAPEDDVLGYIIKAPKGVSEVGPYSVVVISLGESNGIEEGHVLRIRHRKPPAQDPVTRKLIELPEEDSGLLMVFRVFERVSYALVLNATRSIHIHDSLVSPLK
jgi:hypothetical protein